MPRLDDGATHVVRVARLAMATRFEAVLRGPRPEALRAAAEDALDEVQRVEAWISPYLHGSALSRIHREAHLHPVPVEPPVFDFLSLAADLVEATGGTFDPTVGPLLRAWGFRDGQPSPPGPEAFEEARARVGWHHVQLDPATRSVRFLRHGVDLHPGAIGKGWALDRAAGLLREAGVESALLHGGTSSVVAIGPPPSLPPWPVALPVGPEDPVGGTVVELRDATLSVSAAWGRSVAGPAHVLDPRTGRPVPSGRMAAVALPSAAASDAWSTALLVDPTLVAARLAARHAGARWWTG